MSKQACSGRAGFGIIEVLISAAILGVLLTVLAAFLTSQQRVTSQQISFATLNNEVRLAFLRISDIVAQANYIYPADQNLKINGTTYQTGEKVLAVLVPAGTAYCNIAGQVYCGFAFSIEARGPYAGILGSSPGSSGFALVEHRVTGIGWTRGTVPDKTWVDAALQSNPLLDSVNPDISKSSLAAEADLTIARYRSKFDGDKPFKGNSTKAADALISTVASRLTLSYTLQGKTLEVKRENTVFARAIPRETFPNQQ